MNQVQTADGIFYLFLSLFIEKYSIKILDWFFFQIEDYFVILNFICISKRQFRLIHLAQTF